MSGSALARTLTVACFHEDLLPGIRAVLPEFERQTGMSVRAQAVPHGSYELWIRTQMLSGDPPDIVLVDDLPLINRYGQSGLLQSIDALFAAPSPYDRSATPRPWRDVFKTELIQQARDPSGRLWSVPFTQYGVGFFYNRAVYEKLHLTPPATWEQLISNFEAVRASGATAIACAVRANDAQTVWMADMILELLLRPVVPEVNLRHAAGWHYEVADPASTRDEAITLDERLVAFAHGVIDPARSPAFRETARLMREMAREFRPDFLSLDGEEVTRIFGRGESVHFLNGTWYLRELSMMQRSIAQTAPERVFPWGVFPFPELTAESTKLPRLGGITQNSALRVCLALPRHKNDAPREDAAVALAQFLTAPTVTSELFKNTNVYDLPAMAEVPPKAGVESLAPPRRNAFLQVAQFRGYDARGEAEFWTLWQRFLGRQIELDDFLRGLSASHRAALARLAAEQAPSLDQNFLKAQLPGGFAP
ncbi:MAG TPA: extracellular solute-binding protein [Opitutaceae bacterium]|nr:extracellular solute-binding protein [Opitutaceae bacterium]